MSAQREVPECLRKRGIVRITDNVPEGHQVRLPPQALFNLCGEALLERIREKAEQNGPPDTPIQGDEHAD